MDTVIMAAGYVVVAFALASAGVLFFGGLWHRIVASRHLRERAGLFEEEMRVRLGLARVEYDRGRLGWSGQRKFEVVRVEPEADQVRSFYLKPHDRRPLPPYEPGQYLTFNLRIPGESKPVVRCYSLSDAPGDPSCYRVTIKKIVPPPDRPELSPGLASSYFHDRIEKGAILDVYSPHGHFTLDQNSGMPVVLIGGGVGLTPVLSMLNAICASGLPRETWFFYGVRHRGEHVMYDHLDRIHREFEHVNAVVCYSRPTGECVAGRDYHHHGIVDIDLLKRRLPSNNYDFYICGPPPMMRSLSEALREWGVPDDRVHMEAFGAATVKAMGRGDAGAEDEGKEMEVSFALSGKKCVWKSASGSLLDLAEANGVSIDSGCRAGNCGTCLVALKEGTVSYLTTPGIDLEEGTCLACAAVPAEPLVLNA